MDLFKDQVFRELKKRIRLGLIRWLHLAPPCKTFSRTRRRDRYGTVKILRSNEKQAGLEPIPAKVREDNLLMQRSAVLSRAMIRAGGWFSIENQPRVLHGSTNQ
jgi:hypothetical protein